MELPSLEGVVSLLQGLSSSITHLSAIKKSFDGKGESSEINLLQRQLQEIFEKAIQIQKDQIALLDKNAKLEQALKEKEQWESERKRYGLCQIKSGELVRMFKREEANGDPTHIICAQCFNNGCKSFFEYGLRHLRCHTCKATVSMGNGEKMDLGLSETPPRRFREWEGQ